MADDGVCPSCGIEFRTCMQVEEGGSLTTQFFEAQVCVVSSQNGTGTWLYVHTPGGER